MTFNKAFPYILVVIALVGLWLNYKAYQNTVGDCGCTDALAEETAQGIWRP